jgi:hypothetical protein
MNREAAAGARPARRSTATVRAAAAGRSPLDDARAAYSGVMRSATGIAALLWLGLLIVPVAAERAWKVGTWGPRGEGRVFVIETARDLITVEAAEGTDETALEATEGHRAQFAIESSTVYILDSKKVEHRLTLRSSAAKYATSYSALGGGHYIKSVAPGGTSLTLEDGSRWDVDPRQYFAVAAWQPDDLISIRRSNSDPAFAFEVDNTSQDDGSLANYRVR